MLGPVFSGPKAQIFAVSFFSQPYLSTKSFALILGSDFGPISPFSIASGNPSYKGSPTQYNLLCLLGDLDKQT